MLPGGEVGVCRQGVFRSLFDWEPFMPPGKREFIAPRLQKKLIDPPCRLNLRTFPFCRRVFQVAVFPLPGNYGHYFC